jgi:hypothetical protein
MNSGRVERGDSTTVSSSFWKTTVGIFSAFNLKCRYKKSPLRVERAFYSKSSKGLELTV